VCVAASVPVFVIPIWNRRFMLDAVVRTVAESRSACSTATTGASATVMAKSARRVSSVVSRRCSRAWFRML
jgi:hypothetical protein